VNDPEGNHIEFVERDRNEEPAKSPDSAVSRHMIHAGFVVNIAMWRITSTATCSDFICIGTEECTPAKPTGSPCKVPDGTDWLEYMLHHPEHPDMRLMGVLNHISLGVTDMKKAQSILESHGWKPHGK